MPVFERTVVALTKKNSNAAEILTFLHKLVGVSFCSHRFVFFGRVLMDPFAARS